MNVPALLDAPANPVGTGNHSGSRSMDLVPCDRPVLENVCLRELGSYLQCSGCLPALPMCEGPHEERPNVSIKCWVHRAGGT
eukprot:6891787-Karenia_brevis.AAC.1